MSSRSMWEKINERQQDAPLLSSKVAKFNNAPNIHQNPFYDQNTSRPKFNKDVYGKPVSGSLTEARGQKASMHVTREMLELCEVINSEGFPQSEETPELKVILFGELFDIYVHISNKVVGLLLRARKHNLIDFEGEILFQRRDDHVPIFMLKPITEIRDILIADIEVVRQKASANPQATTVLVK